MASTAGSIVLGIFADVAQLKTDLQRANHEHRGLLRQGDPVARQLDEDGRRVCLGLRRDRSGPQWHRPRRRRQAGDRGRRQHRGPGRAPGRRDRCAPGVPVRRARRGGRCRGRWHAGIAKLNKLLGEAGAGHEEAVKSFQDLGIAFDGRRASCGATEDVVRSWPTRSPGPGRVAEKTRHRHRGLRQVWRGRSSPSSRRARRASTSSSPSSARWASSSMAHSAQAGRCAAKAVRPVGGDAPDHAHQGGPRVRPGARRPSRPRRKRASNGSRA